MGEEAADSDVVEVVARCHEGFGELPEFGGVGKVAEDAAEGWGFFD